MKIEIDVNNHRVARWMKDIIINVNLTDENHSKIIKGHRNITVSL